MIVSFLVLLKACPGVILWVAPKIQEIEPAYNCIHFTNSFMQGWSYNRDVTIRYGTL